MTYTLDDYKPVFSLCASEKHLIMMSIVKHKTRKDQAKALRISERGLYLKMERHGLK